MSNSKVTSGTMHSPSAATSHVATERDPATALVIGAISGALCFELCAFFFGPAVGIAIAVAAAIAALLVRHAALPSIFFGAAAAFSAMALALSTQLLIVASLMFGVGLALLARRPSNQAESN